MPVKQGIVASNPYRIPCEVNFPEGYKQRRCQICGRDLSKPIYHNYQGSVKIKYTDRRFYCPHCQHNNIQNEIIGDDFIYGASIGPETMDEVLDMWGSVEDIDYFGES